MISYEKVKQSFRSFTILSIVINVIVTVIYLLGIAGILLLMANLNNPKFTAAYTDNQLATLKLSITPFAIFMSVLSLAIAISIIVFSALNLSKLNKIAELSYVPHFLGLGVSVLNILFSFTDQISILTLVIQAALIAMYYYTYSRAKLLNQQLEEEED